MKKKATIMTRPRIRNPPTTPGTSYTVNSILLVHPHVWRFLPALLCCKTRCLELGPDCRSISLPALMDFSYELTGSRRTTYSLTFLLKTYCLVINGFGKQPESFNLIQFKKKESTDSFLNGKYNEIF